MASTNRTLRFSVPPTKERPRPDSFDPEGPAVPMVTREWLVTNGLGGYAAGTIAGVITRRFHGLLIAALAPPHGRTMMLNYLAETIQLADGRLFHLGAQERPSRGVAPLADLAEFRLEDGLPVWRYQIGELAIEKRILLPHRQNTVHISYTLLGDIDGVNLELEPWVHFRPHEGPLNAPITTPYAFKAIGDRYEISTDEDFPPLKIQLFGAVSTFTIEGRRIENVSYRIEEARGYEAFGDVYSPGHFRCPLTPRVPVTFVASTESWGAIRALTPSAAQACERERRARLVSMSHTSIREGYAAELIHAADQFLITPPGRLEDATRARATGDEIRTMIAGYHWFTDWGRDTMISLEGLTLVTGRHVDAGYILRTFAHYVRDGLIPNMFPEGNNAGLYHTADATLWFFHAIERYLSWTRDRATLRQIFPTLVSILDHHIYGTRFGIHVDPADGLLSQGQDGYQLTWMDAKVGDYVVTPRRGKAVEINALFYNALRILEQWHTEAGDRERATKLREHADRVRASFNARFWNAKEDCLFDVVDGERGDDPAFRPNQLLAISLAHPVLEKSRWESVLSKVEAKLLTPSGLRSLAPGHPDYKAKYFGDLRSRDLAYHQGTVWAWLVGPFIDAWIKVHPDRRTEARKFLLGFEGHLNEACVGSISEIFDADEPFIPRGCVAQAWSVAEVLRCIWKTSAV